MQEWKFLVQFMAFVVRFKNNQNIPDQITVSWMNFVAGMWATKDCSR